eukprot:TRINITY_DN4617_c0_g1_i1.p1 TRINITY_DN4617_c0_g1~~TRINITY_DN4617_c0_g1_i1.p1  ORF type:complete len:333 (-),score=84.65 TRINITY_DN4617_c0_g1_i1:62-1060(-)
MVVCALLLLAGGVYASYLAFGLIQEHLTLARYGAAHEAFAFTAFLVLTQCMGNCFIALIALWAKKRRTGEPIAPAAPARSYLLMGTAYVGAMFCSNRALLYIDFPTQALSKSTKAIPVLLMSLMFGKHRKYSWEKILYVTVVTAAVSAFMIERTNRSSGGFSQSSSMGLFLIGGSLLLDGVTGLCQDHITDTYHEDSFRMMLGANLVSCILMSIGILVTGELRTAVQFCVRYPSVVPLLALFSLASACGQACIYAMITRFGVLTVTTVTTTRKFLTVLLSVLWFQHPLSPTQWLCVAAVFVGVALDLRRCSPGQAAKAAATHLRRSVWRKDK